MKMLAAQVSKFGGPEVIKVSQVPIPEPKNDEVGDNVQQWNKFISFPEIGDGCATTKQ